jgi:hypothetical protein
VRTERTCPSRTATYSGNRDIKNILFKSSRTKLGIASNKRKYSRLLRR